MGDTLDKRGIGLYRLEKWARIECCPRYFVSSFGRVRRMMSGYSKNGRLSRKPAMMMTCVMVKGSLAIRCHRRKAKPHLHYVSTLVAKHFLPGEGQIRKRNGDPWDCSVYNLVRLKPKPKPEPKPAEEVLAEDNIQ